MYKNIPLSSRQLSVSSQSLQKSISWQGWSQTSRGWRGKVTFHQLFWEAGTCPSAQGLIEPTRVAEDKSNKNETKSIKIKLLKGS